MMVGATKSGLSPPVQRQTMKTAAATGRGVTGRSTEHHSSKQASQYFGLPASMSSTLNSSVGGQSTHAAGTVLVEPSGALTGDADERSKEVLEAAVRLRRSRDANEFLYLLLFVV